MNKSTNTPPPNMSPDPSARISKRRRSASWMVVLALLLIGIVVAGVVWGPQMLRLLPGQTTIVPKTSVDVERFAAQRQHEIAQLGGYGWIDKQAGVAHIPIQAAMALIAKSGLPVGVTPTPTAAPAASAAISGTAEASAGPAVDLAHVSFKDNVLPIFQQHCAECHGDEKSEQGLKLIRYRTVMAGSQNGPVVEPGDPDSSYLVEMVVTGKMPKKGDPLSATEIDIIKAWIAAGAKDN